MGARSGGRAGAGPWLGLTQAPRGFALVVTLAPPLIVFGIVTVKNLPSLDPGLEDHRANREGVA